MEFFEVKVKRITKEGDEPKTLKEAYCIEAVSYTEAETRFAEFMAKNHAEDSFTVLKISTSKYSHLAKGAEDISAEDPFFKVKILSYYQKEGSKKERSHKILALIHAKDPIQVATAGATLGDELSDTRYEVVRIEKTQIAGVIINKNRVSSPTAE